MGGLGRGGGRGLCRAAGAAAEAGPLVAALEAALAAHADGPRVLILRDYHAGNLLWLPGGRAGRVGLLDFQLAQMGQPEYDLVSLVQDARRDVGPAAEAAALAAFAAARGVTAAESEAALAVLGACGPCASWGSLRAFAWRAASRSTCRICRASGGSCSAIWGIRRWRGWRRPAALSCRNRPGTSSKGSARNAAAPISADAVRGRVRHADAPADGGAAQAADPGGGRPLIDRALDLAREAGAGPIVVNTHYLGAQIAAHLAGAPDVAISDEPGEILETGGGLRQALPMLGDGPVMTLNPDAVWRGPNPLDLLARGWDAGRMDALLLVQDAGLCGAAAGGRISPGTGRAAGAGSGRRGGRRLSGRADPADRGAGAGRGARLFPEPAVGPDDRGGAAFGLPYPGAWCDVGSLEGLAEAEAMLAEGGGP